MSTPRPKSAPVSVRVPGMAVRYPGRRDFLARVLRRTRVHYELRVP